MTFQFIVQCRKFILFILSFTYNLAFYEIAFSAASSVISVCNLLRKFLPIISLKIIPGIFSRTHQNIFHVLYKRCCMWYCFRPEFIYENTGSPEIFIKVSNSTPLFSWKAVLYLSWKFPDLLHHRQKEWMKQYLRMIY